MGIRDCRRETISKTTMFQEASEPSTMFSHKENVVVSGGGTTLASSTSSTASEEGLPCPSLSLGTSSNNTNCGNRRPVGRRQPSRRGLSGWLFPTAKGLLLTVLLGILTGSSLVGAGSSRQSSVSLGGDSPKVMVCPPAREITPCLCSVITKGLDIVCDHTDEHHIRNALNVLKKNSYSVYWMKFRNCVLPRLTDFIFMSLNVNHLNIIRSNVSVIERSSLSALSNSLESLDLANNHLQEVPSAALRGQETLTFLNLNYNRIQALHEEAFQGMIVLQRLTLYENNIKKIHHNAFKGITRLTRLNLGKNNLSNIPSDSFHPLINLEVLDIHENHIRHIPDAAFEGLTKLDMLKMEHNSIEMIQNNVFQDLKLLNSLNIEHNMITNISSHAFAGLEPNLGWLELGNNRLDHIPSHALRMLHSLRQLDLDSNRIQSMQEDAFEGYGDTLKYIVLDKNYIKAIPPLALEDLHSLEWLKLAHNEITNIPEDTVQPILDTLKMLDISNNPLVCSCDILWLRHWLLNPYNRDNIESINDHMCVTTDHKAHVIKALPENAFDCPHPRTGGSTQKTSASSAVVATAGSVGLQLLMVLITPFLVEMAHFTPALKF